MRNWIIKIAVLVVAVAIAVTTVLLFQKNNDPAADAAGSITVELTDLSGRSERHVLTFSEGDSLESLLQKHFDVVYDQGQYGAVLMGIDFIRTDFKTTYVSIYVNDQYATYGLSGLKPVDGYVYSFREARV